jgi:hypothetical protein
MLLRRGTACGYHCLLHYFSTYSIPPITVRTPPVPPPLGILILLTCVEISCSDTTQIAGEARLGP